MGRLDVRVCSARNLPGALIGKPKTYCRVKVENDQKETQEKSSENPCWDEVLKFHVPQPEGNKRLLVEVWEHTVVGSDTVVGRCDIALGDLPYGKVVDQWYRLQQCDNNSEIRLRLIAKDFGIEPSQEDAMNASSTLTTVASMNLNALFKEESMSGSVNEAQNSCAPVLVQSESVVIKGAGANGNGAAPPPRVNYVPLETSQNAAMAMPNPGVPQQPQPMMQPQQAPLPVNGYQQPPPPMQQPYAQPNQLHGQLPSMFPTPPVQQFAQPSYGSAAQPAYPMQAGYPMAQPQKGLGYPPPPLQQPYPPQGGYPPPTGYPPQQGYPPAGYPGAQPQYPMPSYPAHPSYPSQPGYPTQPGYPVQPGYPPPPQAPYGGYPPQPSLGYPVQGIPLSAHGMPPGTSPGL